jgi:hypothetical protein
MSIHDLDAKRRSETLEHLEGVEWELPQDSSDLMLRCHALRKKPIGDFSIENLRFMIGQQVGIFFLLPVALEVLEEDPLAEGDFYPGDLLGSVLRVDPSFWQRHTDWKARLDSVIAGLSSIPKEIADDLAEYRKWLK